MQDQAISFDSLKTKHRHLRDDFPQSVSLRVHRALSWLQRAEQEVDDFDAAFIFLWIAFNAAYAEDILSDSSVSERTSFEGFFAKVIAVDRDSAVYNAIWERFSESTRIFLDNRFVFQPFWSHYNGLPGYADWQERFDRSKRRISRALAEKDTKVILTSLFDRLYVLRNQLVHGGATWNSSVNRAQVQDGSKILKYLVPVFINLMMMNPQEPWGPPYYPVVTT